MSDSENRREIFTQDGVLLKKSIAAYITYLNKIGSLNIVEYSDLNSRSRLIEWKTNIDTIIDSDIQDREWTVVESVFGRTRTLSGSSSLAPATITINFEDIKSFRVSNKSRQLTFYDGSSELLLGFLFQHGNCDHFVAMLKSIFKTAPAKRDKQLYVVVDINTQETQQLTKSFAELNLFPDNPPTIFNFVKKLHERPYETTYEAFSRVTDFVYKFPEKREIDEDEKELLNKSLTEYSSSANLHGDYLVVGNGVDLPPRRSFPRGKPVTVDQWRGFQDSEGRIEDAHLVRNMIFRGGVSPQLRQEVWKYLLEYYPWEYSHKERAYLRNQKSDEYFKMKLQWKSFTRTQEENFADFRERKSLIEKDVNRTDRTMEFFAGDDNPNLLILFDILMTYVMYNFDLGYVQGMSDLLSPILYLLKDEVDAFWCFVGFMNKVYSNFDIDQAGMKEQLTSLSILMKFVAPQFSDYLEKHDSGNFFFCFRWLLVWFKRELNQEDINRLWEVLWTSEPCENFHLLVAVAILDSEKQKIIENEYGFTEILKHINDLNGKLDIIEVISQAEAIYHQIKESEQTSDSVRIILGLPLLPSEAVQYRNAQDNSSFDKCTELSSNGNQSLALEPSVVRFNNEEEVSFERSISNNYL